MGREKLLFSRRLFDGTEAGWIKRLLRAIFRSRHHTRSRHRKEVDGRGPKLLHLFLSDIYPRSTAMGDSGCCVGVGNKTIKSPLVLSSL
jgi:hypothetical protein